MILKKFNVERIATTEQEIARLKAEGFEEVKAPKKKAVKKGDKNGSNK